ncbi:MAG: thioesterase-like protein [Alphaproteobacteria bacterium]|jgi:acyl-CoA thioester hydrolase|nr:thioesterase-like protein [Alphaproteobacteria bacterium]
MAEQDRAAAAPAPLGWYREIVRPEWIDYNGHMNVAYYSLVFDHATDAVLDHFGIGPTDYVPQGEGSLFVVEAHITYDREVRLGDTLAVATQFLGLDAKRLQLFHTMVHAGEGYQVSTSEIMLMHVDQVQRRSSPIPGWAAARLQPVMEAHGRLDRPERAGRRIALPRAEAATTPAGAA